MLSVAFDWFPKVHGDRCFGVGRSVDLATRYQVVSNGQRQASISVWASLMTRLLARSELARRATSEMD